MTGKLVRDGIPRLIIKDGGNPNTRTLSDEEYLIELDRKLQEEVAEYLEHNDLAELGDVLEVVRAIADARGEGIASIEKTREQKFKERGGFSGRVFLDKS